MSPGKLGWIGVAAVVAAADGYAIARRKPTMSDEFRRHFGWGTFVASGTFAHLVWHR